MLIFAALLVAVGAFLAIAFLVQMFYLGLGLRAMRSYSQKADRNVMATQRAFVYVSELTWSGEAIFKCSNFATGKTSTTPRGREK